MSYVGLFLYSHTVISVLGAVLYLLYTSDLPTFEQNIVAKFADDTAIMAIGDNNTESTEKLQAAISKVQNLD